MIAADKIAATTQRAIEDSFRPFFVVLTKVHTSIQEGRTVDESVLDDLHVLGQSISNASVFCEVNREKQALAVLKPGSEKLLNQDSTPLMSQHAVAALQAQRDHHEAVHGRRVHRRDAPDHIQP